MTKTFSSLLEQATNVAYTENGAISNASTLNSVLDLFSQGGAMRTRTEDVRYQFIANALGENFELGLRTIFYLADVRGGQGERQLFKIALKVLADRYPKQLVKIVDLIPEFGRWDYLYELKGTKVEEAMIQVMRNEHTRCNLTGETSLMYKWIKSPNTSSAKSRELGRWTAQVLGYESNFHGIHQFQKMLAQKRAQLGDAVVETKMSRGKFHLIDYSKVTSKAGLCYKTSFFKRDQARYEQFHNRVEKGEVKINVGTLYPHEIVCKYDEVRGVDNALENMWNALQDFIKSEENILTMVDVSYSMNSIISNGSRVRAIDVSRALGIYTAQHIKGAFKNKAILFSSQPKFIDFDRVGSKLIDYINYIKRFNDCSNTDLQASFDLVLKTAIANKIPESEMPTKILIISDMEFDATRYNATNLDVIKAKYASAGYKMPQLVYWNVCARTQQFPATKFDKGVAMVSGYSPSLLADILQGDIVDPIVSMLKVINKPRYDVVIERIREA